MPRHICRISHVMLAMSEADAIANQAEDRKRAKYAELLVSHHFVPVAIETSGVFGQEVLSFIRELGSCLQAKTGEPQLHHHMKQDIAVAMQRGNVVMELGTMTIHHHHHHHHQKAVSPRQEVAHTGYKGAHI